MKREELSAVNLMLQRAKELGIPGGSVLMIPDHPSLLDRLLIKLPAKLVPQSIKNRVLAWDQWKARNSLPKSKGETVKWRRSVSEVTIDPMSGMPQRKLTFVEMSADEAIKLRKQQMKA